jgi:acyl-CoA thioesterase-1
LNQRKANKFSQSEKSFLSLIILQEDGFRTIFRFRDRRRWKPPDPRRYNGEVNPFLTPSRFMRPALWLLLLSCVPTSLKGETIPLTLTTPRPHQVVQRIGFDARNPDRRGFAEVTIQAVVVQPSDQEIWEYRVIPLTKATEAQAAWNKLIVPTSTGKLDATARIPAGGWYRLEVRGRIQDRTHHSASVEPIGVGEVYLVAGQSYATNCNDEKFQVSDPLGRVSAWNRNSGNWGTAHDPQPTADNSKDGSIWPIVGDALVKEFGVPIGFANVAYGGTSSTQWMPGKGLHDGLIKAGQTLGQFRGVLWQQGESDVIDKTTTAAYVDHVKSIRQKAVEAYKNDAPWLLAKSTYHPTVYNDPEGEGRIRSGIDELTKLPGFLPGPDTDTLKGDSRGDAKSRRHFTGVGQRRAAEMWFTVLKNQINSPPTHGTLADWNLLAPAWTSSIVHNESSILLQKDKDGPTTARLAFPASEIVNIASASGQYRFLANDYTLSPDGLTVTFQKPGPIEVIKTADFFPPKDAPNSYRHRAGHPEQNMLYRPGRWFHDHNVEITYKRRDLTSPKSIGLSTNLPKTFARLKAGKPIILGISGDSISTGADASAIAKAAPNQPGYPDLVAAQLQESFKTKVTLKNRAVGGWSVANGVADLDKLLAEKPDLIVVAYGMNDVGRRDPKWFAQETRKILDGIRKANPEADVILVSPMLGHNEWVHTPREMFAKYRDELKGLTGPGIALADVTQVWTLLLKQKHDLDLTGNGLNHPNDFGHRLYAQVILELLVERK